LIPNHNIEVEKQALQFLRDYALTAFIYFFVSHTLITITIYQTYDSFWLIIWFITFIFLQFLSLLYRRTIPRLEISHEKKIRRGSTINIIDGILVSSCVIFLPFVDDIARMLIVSLLLISCTGAIVTTLGYTRLYLSFCLPVLFLIIASLIIVFLIYNASQALLLVAAVTLIITYPLFKVSSALSDHFKSSFITNLKLNEMNEELKLAFNEVEKANESKTRFLACASHDLRQPINTLSLFVASLTLKDKKEENKEILNHMNTAISSIDSQLESLLDISKLDAGEIEIKKQTEKISLRFKKEVAELIIHSDLILLERILSNLLSNAIKYTEAGYIEIVVGIHQEKATISINDTGIGIAPNELNNIFDEFYQINNSARSSENGLGLGLSIVKRLSNLLDIEINLESQHGVGTTVTTKLDFKKSVDVVIEKNSTEYTVWPDDIKRIVVLDNETNILLAMRSALEEMGHYVETYSDAKSTLLSFKENQFDIALIDYRLPGLLDGCDVINKIKKISPITKNILVTGDSLVGHIENEKMKIIHKPITGNKLKDLFSD